jgi:hypothetical protein
MLSLLLALAISAEPSYPADIEVHLSLCASGGFDYFFFADGTVISKCWGCEARPYVQLGIWKRDGRDVVVAMRREWLGQGRGRIVAVASINVYEDYTAVAREGQFASEVTRFTPDFFTDGAPEERCYFPAPHLRARDPHAFIRFFDGEFPETYQRLLRQWDLSERSVEVLRLMRNEIFARYGYRFKEPELLAYFKKHRNYEPRLSNVDAFLSEIEKENIKRLTVAEADAKAKATKTPTFSK